MHRRFPPDSGIYPPELQQLQPEMTGKTAAIYQKLHSRDERKLVPKPVKKSVVKPREEPKKLPPISRQPMRFVLQPPQYSSYPKLREQKYGPALSSVRPVSVSSHKKPQPQALPQKNPYHEILEQVSKLLRESELRLQQLQLKQQFKIQQRKIQGILDELKRKNKGALKETLFEKIVNSDECKQYMSTSGANPSLQETPDSSDDYSQSVLLNKIHLYLASVRKPKLSDYGHCHGITLLWLTMMYLGFEPLFYKMVKDITECPDGELHTIEKKITTFLEWIDLGQNPQNYSNNTYHQRDVAKIIGGVTEFSAVKKIISEPLLPYELTKVSQENHMICFAGKGMDKRTNRYGGHAIGVFVKKTPTGKFNYSVFDPNYKSNRHKEFDSPEAAAMECWHRAFASMIPQLMHLIEIDVVKPQQLTQQVFIEPDMTKAPVVATTSGYSRASLFRMAPPTSAESVVAPPQVSVQHDEIRQRKF
jgi:hypothetical protein